MIHKNLAPACGIYCGTCDFLGKQCNGCGYEKGKPFWTTQIPSRICPIYACCRNQKKMEHCGECESIPCNTFLELRDPSLSDAEFKQSIKITS